MREIAPAWNHWATYTASSPKVDEGFVSEAEKAGREADRYLLNLRNTSEHIRRRAKAGANGQAKDLGFDGSKALGFRHYMS